MKAWKKIMVVLAALLLALLAAALALCWNELRSLCSLERLDDYGLYRMTYYGGYGFDEFLEAGAESGSIKINGVETAVVEIAADAEVTEMLTEVFGQAN